MARPTFNTFPNHPRQRGRRRHANHAAELERGRYSGLAVHERSSHARSSVELPTYADHFHAQGTVCHGARDEAVGMEAPT